MCDEVVDASADEESGSTPVKEVKETNSFKEKLYVKITKELTDKDLSNPGVVKMILARNEEFAAENARLKEIESSYYNDREKMGEYREKEKKLLSLDIMCDVATALGGIFAGLCTYDFSKELKISSGVMLVLGLFCVIGGQFAKRFRK